MAGKVNYKMSRLITRECAEDASKKNRIGGFSLVTDPEVVITIYRS